MMNNKTGIYVLSFPSGKVYIGKCANVNKRWSRYKRLDCVGQTKLYNALRKYGWGSVQAAFYPFPKEWLSQLEVMLIRHYDCRINGYNCTDGGEGQFGRVVSQETRDKIRDTIISKKGGAERLCPQCGLSKLHITRSGRVEAYCIECMRINTRRKRNG